MLRAYGALDGWAATELGDLVAELAGDNELWLAVVMLELGSRADPLEPPQLAAVLGALLDERVRPNAYVGYMTSEAVLEALDGLEARADALYDAQAAAGVDFPISVEGSACALVEAWLRGGAPRDTSLDAGDIFRILRRTTELALHLRRAYVSPAVKRSAAAALRTMNRYPL